jgi:hypothetical protein
MGEGEQYDNLKKLIDTQDAEFLKKYWIFTKGNYYGLTDVPMDLEGSLSLNIDTKWAPPIDVLEELSSEFPDIEFDMEYEEAGCEVFGKCTAKGGDVNDIPTEAEEHYKQNPDYQQAQEDIKEMPYEKLLENFIAPGNIEEYFEKYDIYVEGYQYLEEDIVNRIKKEDLPLLMSFGWMGNGKELYNKLLKGENNGLDNNNVTV